MLSHILSSQALDADPFPCILPTVRMPNPQPKHAPGSLPQCSRAGCRTQQELALFEGSGGQQGDISGLFQVHGWGGVRGPEGPGYPVNMPGKGLEQR